MNTSMEVHRRPYCKQCTVNYCYDDYDDIVYCIFSGGALSNFSSFGYSRTGFRHPGTYPKNLVGFLGTPT